MANGCSEDMNTPNVNVTRHAVTGLAAQALARFGPSLAIDSSLGTSVAVSNGTELVTFGVDDHLSHAEVVAALVAQALAAVDVSPTEVTSVVAGIGPGPFTGLRVGLAAAQAFAVGRSVPLLSLVSHEAVAYAALSADEWRTEVFVVTDARRKELFCTRYGRLDADGLPRLLEAPKLYPRDHPATSGDDGRVDPARIDAAHLVTLAALRSQCGRRFEEPGALYLRSPDVTPQQAPKRVSS